MTTMLTEKEKEEAIDRAVKVTADRVDSLVSLHNFHELSSQSAIRCLQQCIKATMLETDNIHYDIVTKLKSKKVYLNIKLFSDGQHDYDVQLRYAID